MRKSPVSASALLKDEPASAVPIGRVLGRFRAASLGLNCFEGTWGVRHALARELAKGHILTALIWEPMYEMAVALSSALSTYLIDSPASQRIGGKTFRNCGTDSFPMVTPETWSVP